MAGGDKTDALACFLVCADADLISKSAEDANRRRRDWAATIANDREEKLMVGLFLLAGLPRIYDA